MDISTSKYSIRVHFLNINGKYNPSKSLILREEIYNPHFNIDNIPEETVCLKLTWNDKALDYHLPTIISCNGVHISGKEIERIKQEKDRIILITDLVDEDININNKPNQEYLAYNTTVVVKQTNEQLPAQVAFYPVNEFDLNFDDRHEIEDYINSLPTRAVAIKQYRLTPPQ